MDESNNPTLSVSFGHCLMAADIALIRQCLELLKYHSGIRYVEIPEAGDGYNNELLAKNDEPLLAIRAITSALFAIGRPREGETLDHVLYLCSEDQELGGYSISSTQPLTDSEREKVAFLVDSWLYAAAQEAANQVARTNSVTSIQMRQPMTLSEKIFAHHMLPGNSSTGVKSGDVIRVSVDWILASEVSWMGMLKTINAVGATKIWRNDRFWLAGDHIVDPRNKHLPKVKALIEMSEQAQKDYKLTNYMGQNYTIMHTEFVHERAQPGMLIVGSDSHTCSSGAVSCLGIGLGAADVAMSLLTGISWFKVPECIEIQLLGKPEFGIGGKDVILHILGELKKNTVAANRIVEFCGPGIQYLSCDDRFAICNMCTEFGAITGLFVPDTTVRDYIDRRKRKLHKMAPLYFRPDDDANYAERFKINLEEVQPYIALYPSPDNVVPVSSCGPMCFDGVFIGACTTTEEDLILAALVLRVGIQKNMPLKKGKRHVVFGSLPITKRLRELGIQDIYTQAGFDQSAPGCSFCVGMGADRAAEGETWLSSQNRNFKNRMGKGSFGNISSAAVVAASSFTMTLTNPTPFLQKVDKEVYKVLTRKNPSQKQRELSGLIYTEPQISTRCDGPGHVGISNNSQAIVTPEWIISSKVQNIGDFIDTDAIIPAEHIVGSETDEGLGSHCLEHTHPEFRDAVKSGHQVVVAGEGFGCGSSREDAPRALIGIGVKCVIAKSFAFIYSRNQSTLGLLGITIRDPSFYETAAVDGTEITISVYKHEIIIGQRKWTFQLDNLEIMMLQNKGLAEAYKKFGKNVFDSLCEGSGNTTMEVEEQVDHSLEW
ncbi:Aconitase family [Aspergillus sclerotialis]|uniref:Aconitase family n=1 Tax=Aspergillus sclerotialis TaxID=2070753 RepID=A0A3A2ZAC0_9EURO|nr:Aconitase family [Aspergillus sclerotialis]